MGYALRHLADLGQTFDEFHRILAPGGHVLILEISRPRSRWKAALARAYFGEIVPLISLAVTGRRRAMNLMRYYWDTIDACLPPESIVAALRQSGFVSAQQHVELGLFSEYTAIKND
jgi:demethylmenaquinone methyltransferase/2-methoxy-6-polyprenyl-1,4-benzoquinol methylase